jgi:TPR repeat protein
MYRTGEAGLRKDSEQAAKWASAAAQRGDPTAQYDLAFYYSKGLGVRPDLIQANKWAARAALQGHREAQNSFGYSLMQGEGVETNPVEAYKWLSLALAQGDTQARANLAALEARLSPEQIDEGKRRAADFKPKPEPSPEQQVFNLETALSGK